MKPIVFLNSHPIQYFTPLYSLLSSKEKLDILVLYCSDETLKGTRDKEFGVQVIWDTPLLDGYPYLFLKNNAISPSIFHGFFGLINLGIFKILLKQPSSIIIVHGWGYVTHLITLIFAKIFGHEVCLRTETPLHQELHKQKIFIFFKHFLLKIMFKRIKYFLYIGSENKKFYKYLGVKEKQLIFAPYCVDNSTFSLLAKTANKNSIKDKLFIPSNYKIILFSGKYIDKKRPLDLINAFAQLNNPYTYLVMMGEGELRGAMEKLVLTKGIQKRVLLTGFVNQSLIYQYYAIADLFVMCSGEGETWGLSVNEAMNFGLPLVLSSTTGSSKDLVVEGKNGYIFKTGDINHFTYVLNQVLEFSPADKLITIETNEKLLKKYSYRTIIDSLKKISQ